MPKFGLPVTPDMLERIHDLRRKRADGTTETIAEFCEWVGLNETALSSWGREGATISLYALDKISRRTGVGLDYLVYGPGADSGQPQILDRVTSEITEVLRDAYRAMDRPFPLRLIHRPRPDNNHESPSDDRRRA